MSHTPDHITPPLVQPSPYNYGWDTGASISGDAPVISEEAEKSLIEQSPYYQELMEMAAKNAERKAFEEGKIPAEDYLAKGKADLSMSPIDIGGPLGIKAAGYGLSRLLAGLRMGYGNMLWNTPLAAAPSVGGTSFASPTLGQTALASFVPPALQDFVPSTESFMKEPSLMGGLNVAGNAIALTPIGRPALGAKALLTGTKAKAPLKVLNKAQQAEMAKVIPKTPPTPVTEIRSIVKRRDGS